MKKHLLKLAILLLVASPGLTGCGGSEKQDGTTTSGSTENISGGAGQSAVVDDVSERNVVQVAIGSKDHTILVKAVQAAELVNVLSNAGPFTVFAPTDQAFGLLPAGTLDDLVKPENKSKLSHILQHHVTTSMYTTEMLTDGMSIGMVDGGHVKITVKDGKIMVNDATILGTVKASNGMVHVVDKVILPE